MMLRCDATFRPDVQGLRAVCILSVVLFHARIPGLTGGFVGVDVFFVISGFLIGGLLFDELMRSGTVDLVSFVARRIRRLLPNATATILVTLVLSAWLLPPFSRATVASDALAATLFFANYRFAEKVADYFRHDDPSSPFLHFWSLSIEEHFYLVIPILLLLVARYFSSKKVAVAIVIAAIAIASFALNVFVLRDNQPAAFFRTETRCWQLAVGFLVALALRRYGPLSLIFRVTGLVVVFAAVVSMPADALYPGWWALIPTAGAALILWSAPSDLATTAGRFDVLSMPLMQWVGARSYSWYLWHWPILVLVTTAAGSSAEVRAAAVAGSLLVAHGMFWAIEQPIRSRVTGGVRSSLVLIAGATAVAGSLGAAVLYRQIPWDPRIAEWTDLIRKATHDFPRSYADKCHSTFEAASLSDCVYGSREGQKQIVLFGDSHAAQWLAAIDAAAISKGWRVHSWTKTGCPSVEVSMWNLPRRAYYRACDEWRTQALERLASRSKPDLVIIANRVDYDGWIYDRDRSKVLRREESAAAWAAGFDAILSRLISAGIKVLVIRETPTAYRSYANCVMGGGGAKCDRPRSEAVERSAADVAVTAGYHDKGVVLLDLTDAICSQQICPVIRNGTVVFQDSDHLTATFSRSLAPQFEKVFERIDRGESGIHRF